MWHFEYNDAGQLTKVANGALLDDGAGTTYGHDALGRLTTVTAAGLAAAYTLDGAGNRVAATIDGVTTSYDLDLRGLATVLSDGTRRFLPGAPGAGYEEAGAWVGGLTNAQGTVLGAVTATGLVGDLAHYDAWGQPLSGAVSPTDGPGYTGEWTDATGLVNLRFRSYDPTIQRFIGGDTFAGSPASPTTWNRFAYANANPLTYTDPSGHFGVAARSTNGARLVNQLFGSARQLFMALTGRDWTDDGRVSWGRRGAAMGSLIQGVDLGEGIVGEFSGGADSHSDVLRPRKAPVAGRRAAPTDDTVQTVLDSCGLISVIGTVCDLASAGSYALKGDFLNAGLSLLGILPGASEAVGAGRLAARYGDDVIGFATGVARQGDNVPAPKPGSVTGAGSGSRYVPSAVRGAEQAATQGRCRYCGVQTNGERGPTQLNMDHAIPRIRGGDTTFENMNTACRTCNLQKGTKTVEEYLAWLAGR